jgi:hypothetical protein
LLRVTLGTGDAWIDKFEIKAVFSVAPNLADANEFGDLLIDRVVTEMLEQSLVTRKVTSPGHNLHFPMKKKKKKEKVKMKNQVPPIYHGPSSLVRL